MEQKIISMGAAALAALIALGTLALGGCGGKEPPAQPPPAAAPAGQAPAAGQGAAPAADAGSQTLQPTDMTWTPEAMEALLAPIALYPDVVLGQTLVAATNPQEVLDAGNWLLQNQNLKGKDLDEAAKKVGFTAPMRGLLQTPETVDMMCSQLDWTTELGQAYVNDQAGLLDAVQRLRGQAKDVGNLKSSEQLKVDTAVEEGKEVITVSPPSPEVVYVPQYDPVAAYAPPPAAAPATTATTTTATTETGHSTGAMVATGLLSFGAGLLVANVFDDDDDDDYYGYSPHYYGPPMPYYPPYPYRPAYGSGHYPSNGYNRPPNYQHGFNNNTIIVNKDNNYWNNYDKGSAGNRGSRGVKSPISEAKPNRPELTSLNANARNTPKRAAPGTPDSWKGQSSYAGAKAGAGNKAAGARSGPTQQGARNQPKVQGSYAGAKPAVNSGGARPERAAAKPAARPPASPAASARKPTGGDRGRATPQAAKPASRAPAASPPAQQRAPSSAISQSDRSGGSAKAASQRGRQSMPKGVPPKSKSSRAAPRR